MELKIFVSEERLLYNKIGRFAGLYLAYLKRMKGKKEEDRAVNFLIQCAWEIEPALCNHDSISNP